MNRKLLWALLGVVAVGGGVFAYMKYFGAKEKHLGIVPMDAAIVVGFDIKSLASKSDYNGKLKSTKLYKYFEEQSKKNTGEDVQDKILGSVLKDPIGSGLSLGSKVYFFMSSKNSDRYVCTIAALSDEGKFVDMLVKSGLKGKLEKAKNMSYFSLNTSELLCWNDKGLLYINQMGGMYGEESGNVKDIADTYMGQDESKSVLASVYFKKSMKSQKDVSIFLNYGTYFDIAGSISGAAQMEGINKAFKGIYVSANVDFENDKINMTSEMMGEKEALEKMQISNKGGIGDHALQCIANGDMLAMLSANFNMDKTINMLDDMFKPNVELRKSIKSFAEMSGIKYEDMIAALSGEMTLSLAGFESISVVQPSYEMNEATGQFEIVQKSKVITLPKLNLAFGVKNKAVIDKILEQTQLPADNDMRIMAFPLINGMNFYLVSKDKVLFITNNEVFGRAIQSTGKLGELSNKDAKNLAKDNPSAFYMDLNMAKYESLFSSLNSSPSDAESFNKFKSYMSIFTDSKGYGDTKSSEYSINLKSGEGNSLYRLLKQADVFDFE
jgi:hypothetical protein